ncbi:hypothetical protein BDA96_03G185200 [Sorghum bicolor]|nr:hypothetical protein BDA96_03G185200 [Sorghum bicolor]
MVLFLRCLTWILDDFKPRIKNYLIIFGGTFDFFLRQESTNNAQCSALMCLLRLNKVCDWFILF